VLGISFTGMHFIVGLSWSDSLYYTVVTLSTVGYNAPGDPGPGGKLFIAAIIVTGIGIAGYIIGNLTQMLIEEKLILSLGKGGDRRMKDLKNHWIICGLGRYGQRVTSLLAAEEVAFVVIEIDENVVLEAREKDLLVLQGDATEEAVLHEAGIERAAGMIIALADEADTVYTTLTSKAIRKDLRIIARASDAQGVGMLYRAGADKVINPVMAGAASMVRASLQPSVADFLELVNISRKLDLDFGTLTINRGNYMAGQSLAKAPIRSEYRTTVIAVMKPEGEVIYNPEGSYVIDEDDRLIIFGERHQMARLREDVSCINCGESIDIDKAGGNQLS